MTVEQYKTKALDLLQSDIGGDIDGFETKNGKTVRYNKATHDYAVGIEGTEITTMFPLRGGTARFNKLRDRDEKKEEGANE